MPAFMLEDPRGIRLYLKSVEDNTAKNEATLKTTGMDRKRIKLNRYRMARLERTYRWDGYEWQ